MNDNLNIDKRKFWQFVNVKINRIVKHTHVFSIIIILFDEMFNDLKNGKNIKIHNFGIFTLKKMPPRKYFDVRFQKIMQSDGNKILNFSFFKKIKKKLLNNLDIDKTFGDDKNE